MRQPSAPVSQERLIHEVRAAAKRISVAIGSGAIADD
jgi:hypothetical protein